MMEKENLSVHIREIIASAKGAKIGFLSISMVSCIIEIEWKVVEDGLRVKGVGCGGGVKGGEFTCSELLLLLSPLVFLLSQCSMPTN